MGFQWTDDLLTGVADIDAQHKELFSRINGLIDACRQEEDKEEIGKYLEFLREYIAFHFAAEERTMTERKYPGLPEQEREHEAFKKRVNEQYRNYSAGKGASIQVVLATIQSSGEWLVNHIMKTDRAMAAFLKK